MGQIDSCRRSNALNAIQRILVIQFRPVGDVLLATGYLGALQDRFPDASIDFLVKAPYQEVLDGHPHIDRVWILPASSGWAYVRSRIRMLRQIRKQGYDLVIDQQAGTGSGQFAWLSNAPWKLGWADAKWRRIYTLKAIQGPRRYNAFKNFDMLVPLGISPRPFRLHYRVRDASKAYIAAWLEANRLSEGALILISFGSPRAKRRWALDAFRELINLIRRHTPHPVGVIWAPGEQDAARYLEDRCRPPVWIAPPTNLNQAAALVAASRLLICNDGGLNHIAVAVGTPSLAIFGHSSPADWSPQGFFAGHFHLSNPSGAQTGAADFGVSPDTVFAKVQSILSHTQPAR